VLICIAWIASSGIAVVAFGGRLETMTYGLVLLIACCCSCVGRAAGMVQTAYSLLNVPDVSLFIVEGIVTEDRGRSLHVIRMRVS
jgi:hypothetical protein